MHIHVTDNPEQLGRQAAEHCENIIRKAIEEKGSARIVLSTGASQFDTIKHLVERDLPWSRVEMFHLDEYIGLPASHPASFRKYLQERFVGHVTLLRAHFVNGEGDVASHVRELSSAIAAAPIDLGLIGIGENAHIAFNDPPADFVRDDPYLEVDLNEDCKRQQVREGWFRALADVPKQAITMSVKQILKCRTIISCVPYPVKADAILRTLTQDVTPQVPATILKTHADWSLYLDKDSAAQVFPLS